MSGLLNEEALLRAIEETVRKVMREERGPSSRPAEWISIQEAARRLDVSEDTVRRMVSRREYPSTRVGRQIRVDARSLAPSGAEVVDLAARARGR